MRTRYHSVGDDGTYFVTSTIVQWLPVFTSAGYCGIVTDSLAFCRMRKGLLLHAYVIMDNHIHLIVTAPEITSFMRDFKSFTGKKIVELLRQENKQWLLDSLEVLKKEYKLESLHQIWQEGFHPELITSEEMLIQKAEYLHHNPVRRGLVSSPEHWVFSSSSNYSCGTGVVDIDRIA